MAKLVGVCVTNSGDQALASGAFTALTFDTEIYDIGAMHDLGANTERLTCTEAGLHFIWGIIGWEGHAAGRRYTCVALNGVGGADRIAMAGGEWEDSVREPFHLVFCTYELAVDDYVTLLGYQDSGGNLNVQHSGGTYDYAPLFGMHRIG